LVSLEQDTARGIVLTVGDNGEGLPVDCRSGVGLPMLRHRATMIGATLTIDSTPGAGVRVTCVLPPTAATVSD
jgi:signal transduction histidine kinase